VKTSRFFAVTFCLLLVTGLLSLCLGSASQASASPLRVLKILTSVNWFNGTGIADADKTARIITLIRLPRTLGAWIAGAAVAVSGAVLQGVLANPLAAPGIIGIHAGAGLLVVLCLAFLPAAAAAPVLPFAAFAGALGAALLVVAIAQKTGASRITIVLAGIAVSYVLNGIIDTITTLVPDALGGYSDFRIGGLDGLTMTKIVPSACIIAAALIVLLLLTNELDVLTLGEDTAAGLGMRTAGMRILFLILSAALAGGAVSMCGMISFVGLIVPHICRRLLGAESGRLLPGCILGGAFFLNICDLIGRLAARPYELPVGIILSLIGGPFFIALILRRHRQ